MSGERASAQLMEYVYAAGARWRCVVGIRSRTGATVCWAFELRVRGVVHTRVGGTWDVALSSAVRHIPQSTVRRSTPLWARFTRARVYKVTLGVRRGKADLRLCFIHDVRDSSHPLGPLAEKNSGDRAATVPLGPRPRRARPPSGARRPRTGPARETRARDRSPIALASPLTSRSEGKGIADRSLAPGTSFRYFIVIVQLWPLIGRARDAVGMH